MKQCQIITFLILKSHNIENSRIELKGIVLPVLSNQIKVTFIINLSFNLVQLWFFLVSHRNWRKMWVNYWGWGRGGQTVCCLPPPSWPSCSYAYVSEVSPMSLSIIGAELGRTNNLIALRKTKIAYNFGLSECNRVKGLNPISSMGVTSYAAYEFTLVVMVSF